MTTRAIPVIYEASDEQRNTAGPAISVDSANRPNVVCELMMSPPSLVSHKALL